MGTQESTIAELETLRAKLADLIADTERKIKGMVADLGPDLPEDDAAAVGPFAASSPFTSRLKFVEFFAAEATRRCAYGNPKRCDCKYLREGDIITVGRRGSEQSGCCEMMVAAEVFAKMSDLQFATIFAAQPRTAGTLAGYVRIRETLDAVAASRRAERDAAMERFRAEAARRSESARKGARTRAGRKVGTQVSGDRSPETGKGSKR